MAGNGDGAFTAGAYRVVLALLHQEDVVVGLVALVQADLEGIDLECQRNPVQGKAIDGQRTLTRYGDQAAFRTEIRTAEIRLEPVAIGTTARGDGLNDGVLLDRASGEERNKYKRGGDVFHGAVVCCGFNGAQVVQVPNGRGMERERGPERPLSNGSKVCSAHNNPLNTAAFCVRNAEHIGAGRQSAQVEGSHTSAQGLAIGLCSQYHATADISKADV